MPAKKLAAFLSQRVAMPRQSLSRLKERSTILRIFVGDGVVRYLLFAISLGRYDGFAAACSQIASDFVCIIGFVAEKAQRCGIVLNAGLVLTGRSASGAFAPVLDTKVVSAALARGAKVVTMPALPCMSEVTDRGLTFEEAAAGAVKPGQEPMSMFDPTRVNEWWTKTVPRVFGQLPPQWLPLSEAGEVAPERGGESL